MILFARFMNSGSAVWITTLDGPAAYAEALLLFPIRADSDILTPEPTSCWFRRAELFAALDLNGVTSIAATRPAALVDS
jgi:hypothetical protein